MQRLLIAFLILFPSVTRSQTPQLIVQSGHTGAINAIAFSPDGTLVLTAGDDCARLWETRSGRLLYMLKGHNGSVHAAAFSANGKFIVTGGTDSLAITWDTETGKRLYTISGFKFWPETILACPQNNTVLVADGHRGFVILPETGQTVFSINHYEYLESAAYNAGGTLLLTSGWNYEHGETTRSINVWDAGTGNLLATRYSNNGEQVDGCFFIGNSHRIGAWITHSDNNSTLTVFDGYDSWLPTAQSDTVYSSIINYCPSPDGRYIAHWDESGYFMVHKTTPAGRKLDSYLRDCKNIQLALFTPDSKTLVTADDEGALKFWEPEKGTLLKTIPTRNPDITSIAADGSGTYIAAGDFYEGAWLLNIQTGRELHTFKGQDVSATLAVFNTDANRLYTTHADYFLRSWDLVSASQPIQPAYMDGKANALALSPDGKEIAYTDNGGYLGIQNAATGDVYYFMCDKYCLKYRSVAFHHTQHKIVATYCNRCEVINLDTVQLSYTIESRYQDDQLASAVFSPDGQRIMALNTTGDIFVWDAATKQLLITLPYYMYRPASAAYTTDGKSILMTCRDTAVRMVDAADYTVKAELKGFTYNLYTAFANPDNTKLLVGDGDSVKMFDIKRPAQLYSLYTGGKLLAVHWQREKMAVERDGRLLVYDIATGKEQFSLFSFRESDYLFLMPDRKYKITKNIATQLGWVIGLKRYDFDQFDLVNNRPDAVLQALGNTDTALIDACHKAWRKRVLRAGFVPENLSAQLHTPEISLPGIENLPIETHTAQIEITVKAADALYPLARLNVWVNGVPVYGTKGLALKNQKSIKHLVKITLSEGRNSIQFSVINSRGIESFRPAAEIIYTPRQPATVHTWFIGFGVNNYKEEKYTLKYSVKDIQDLARWFSQYPNSTIDTFTDARVTRENILAVKQKLQNTGVEDRVIIAFSGHGLLDDSLNFYYATRDIDFKNPARRGVLYEEIEALLDDIPARKKLLLVDACHSGESDREEPQLPHTHTPTQQQTDTGTLLITRFGSRSVELLDEVAQSGAGLQNSFELMQELFADLSRGTGAHIISAAAGNSYAYEKNELKNGVFTWCILNGLQNKAADFNEDGEVSIAELELYVKQKVSELTKGAQKPTSRSGLVGYDWEL